MRKQFRRWFYVLAVMFLTAILVGCNANQKSVTSAQLDAGNTPAEGINVHGHWTIEVRNPDGTLAEFREFDNALSGLGSQSLAMILGRQASVGGWAIYLLGSTFTGRTPDGHAGVAIVESTYPSGTAYNVSRTLTLTAPGMTDTVSQPLRLTGTATADTNGSITQVETVLSKLPTTEAPSNRYGSSALFTSAILESPVSLTAGQSVTVTVVITFLASS